MGIRDPRTPDCGIDGCARAVRKGRLCAKHYAMVPRELKDGCMIAVMTATMVAAREWHERQLQAVSEIVSLDAAVAA